MKKIVFKIVLIITTCLNLIFLFAGYYQLFVMFITFGESMARYKITEVHLWMQEQLFNVSVLLIIIIATAALFHLNKYLSNKRKFEKGTVTKGGK